MATVVEVSLRVPNMKVRALDEHGYPIDHSAIRFRRIIEVPAIPKPGDVIRLPTASGAVLASTVVRADWHEERGMFVVACQYSTRSISPDHYRALVNDPDWRMLPLLQAQGL